MKKITILFTSSFLLVNICYKSNASLRSFPLGVDLSQDTSWQTV